MGLPGRFGAPELTVLARELAWALGGLGKRHLATVLIGTGTGNLQPRRAVDAMLRGVRDALIGASDETAPKLESLTFAETSARKIRPIQRAIQEAVTQLAKTDPDFQVEYTEISPEELDRLEEEGRERELDEFRQRLAAGDGQGRGRGHLPIWCDYRERIAARACDPPRPEARRSSKRRARGRVAGASAAGARAVA